jgi:hypothetical protein
MIKYSAILLASVACVSIGNLCVAGEVTLSANVSKAFAADFSEIELPFQSVPAFPVILQIDFSLLATPADGESYLDTVIFDLSLNLLSRTEGLGWEPLIETVDISPLPSHQPGPMFSMNIDIGDPTDLKGIAIQLPPGLSESDLRRQRINSPQPVGIGSIFVDWIPQGDVISGVSWNIVSSRFNLESGGVGPEQPQPSGAYSIPLDVPFPRFDSDPDPGSHLDFGVGSHARTLSIATRNIGNPLDDPLEIHASILGDDASFFSLPGYVPYVLVSGEGFTDLIVQFNGAQQAGNFSGVLQLSDQDGTVLATYNLSATVVPEPATLWIVGLSLLGVAAYNRQLFA